MRLFQAALDTPLDSPLLRHSLSSRQEHFTVYALTYLLTYLCASMGAWRKAPLAAWALSLWGLDEGTPQPNKFQGPQHDNHQST